MNGEQIDFGFVMPHWFYWGWLALMPIAMIMICYYLEKKQFEKDGTLPDSSKQGEALEVSANPIIRAFDWISEHTGQFVDFWTITAVFFYAFEVICRYIFNKPTIWVHESSFLLFGMQYLLAGAYAYLHGSHVAVDIIYNKFPKRGQHGLDIFTSVFSFIENRHRTNDFEFGITNFFTNLVITLPLLVGFGHALLEMCCTFLWK